MHNYLRKILRLFAIEWSKTVQYRTDMLLWMLAEAVVPLVSLAIWYTVAASSTRGPTPTSVLTYYLLIVFVKVITDAWNGVFMAQEILNGNIVGKLIRPVAIVWYDIANNVVEKILKLTFPLISFFIILWFFSEHFDQAIFQPTHIMLFSVSLLLAVLVGFLTEFMIGIFAFWLEDVSQIRRYKIMLHELASGVFIPFSFMPHLAQTMLSFLPFRYIISAPVEILLGQTNNQTILSLLFGQFAWTVGLAAASYILWYKGLQRYAPSGQ